MTIQGTTARNDYIGTGLVDTYSYSFKIFTENDLEVVVRNTLNVEEVLALTTDYTVTGVGETGGGTIVLVAGDLVENYILTIRHKKSLIQATSIGNSGKFFPRTHEDTFDKLVKHDQQQQDELDRSVHLPVTIKPSDFSSELPASIKDSPEMLFTVNADGNAIGLVSRAAVATARGGDLEETINNTDYTSSPTLSDFALPTNKIIFTGGGITDILSLVAGTPGQRLMLTNAQATAINVANEDAGETAANRISTGTGGDMNFPVGSNIFLNYDGSSSTWRVVGGSAGAGSLLGVPTDGAYGGPIGPIAGIASGDTSEDAFDKVDTILGLLAPEPPQPLSAKTLVISGSYSARESTSGDTNPIVTDDTTPDINHGTASTLANSFRTGKRGTLSAEVDATEVGTIALTDADNSGSNGNLTIVDDFDPYTGQFGKEGFWAGLIARIIPNALSVGAHNAQLKHTETGNSNLLSFFIDDPVTPTVGTITLDASGATSSHKSGVPGVAQGQNINVTFDVSDAVKTHYNPTRIARASSPQTSSVNETLPGTPPDADDTISADINIAVSSGAYSENVVVTGTGYNSKGDTDTNTASDNIRVDTVGSEVRRISGTGQYPASGYGGTFDATVSLATASNFELQYLNGRFRDPPAVNYSTRTPSGPNYSSLSYDAHNSMRWATFSLGSISSASGVSFTINSPSNFGGSTLVTGIELYVRVDGATPTSGWINANTAYPGVGNPTANGDAALNVGSSTATSKVVTFGAAVKTGTVYVRIGIPDGSNKTFGSIS